MFFHKGIGSFWTIPNIVTLMRIVLTPVIVVLTLKGYGVASFLALIIASLTDWVDGAYARYSNSVTKLGELLDPLADKVLVTTLILLYTHLGLIPMGLCVLVVLRDILILLFGSWILYRKVNIDMTPVFSSKLNTTLILIMVLWAHFLTMTELVSEIALWGLLTLVALVGITTLFSGFMYAQRFVKFCKK